MKYFTKIKNNFSRGVTLIELVVVLAVFMIIISVSATIFISIVQRQRGILFEQEFTNQASYITEYMSRTIRNAQKDASGNCVSFGEIYQLTNYDSLSGFYSGIKFLTDDAICQQFFVSAGVLREIKNGGSSQTILSDKFTINYVRFIINGDKNLAGAFETDTLQPRVTFVLSVKKIYQLTYDNGTSFFKVNYVYAQNNNGIPVCGDGACDPGEAVYCSNSCPFFNDCNVCPITPTTGYSCINNMCVSDPSGTNNCAPNSPCDLPVTGYSCTNNNNICIADPSGTANCVLNSPCNAPPPLTGHSCMNGMCVSNTSGVDACSVGSVCDVVLPPPTNSIQDAIIIQTTVSQKDFII